MSRWVRWIALAGAALLLTFGCSSGGRTSSTDEASATPSGSGTAHANEATAEHPTFAHQLRSSEVLSPGHGLETVRTLSTDSVTTALLGVLRDGRLLVRKGSSLRLESPSGDEVTSIQTPSSEASLGVFDLDDDGRHLVWVTTTARDYFTFPWRMYSLDLETGEVREIAHNRNVGVDPVPVVPDGTRPRLLNGRVYYAAVREVKEGGKVVSAVYSVPADGSTRPRLEVDDAYSPAILSDRLVYLRSAFGFVDWALRSRIPGYPGTDSVLASGTGRANRFGGLAGDGPTLMWQEKTSRGCSLKFLSRRSGLESLGPDRCGPVWSGDHLVAGSWAAFSTGSSPYRTYVFDFTDGSLYRLTDGPTLGLSLGRGDIVAWRPARGPDKGKTIVARMTLE